MEAPPKAAAVAETTVIPTWTVARKRSGWSRSRWTATALPRPASISVASRVRRTATTEISAAAKTALAPMRARMTSSSWRMAGPVGRSRPVPMVYPGPPRRGRGIPHPAPHVSIHLPGPTRVALTGGEPTAVIPSEERKEDGRL
jgi:hypothetical protein